MVQKKKKDPTVVAPFTPVGLKKIGERHGEFISDEFKPKNQAPKPKKKKVVLKPKKQKSPTGSVLPKINKPNSRKPRKTRNPSPKTIAKRIAYSEAFKEELRKNATKAELLFKGNLDSYEIEYEFQKEVITKKSFIVADFYIPSLKLMVELDGGYHNNKEQLEKDRQKDIEYRKNGFKVLRMPNEHVPSFDFDQLKISIDQELPTEYLKRMIY